LCFSAQLSFLLVPLAPFQLSKQCNIVKNERANNSPFFYLIMQFEKNIYKVPFLPKMQFFFAATQVTIQCFRITVTSVLFKLFLYFLFFPLF